MDSKTFLTIAEFTWFTKAAKALLTHEERHELIDYIATDPESGDLIEGTGGFRKLRWRRQGMGKSSGLRVIYYYYNENYPVLLTDMFAKNEKENLSKEEKNALNRLGQQFISSYERRYHHGKKH